MTTCDKNPLENWKDINNKQVRLRRTQNSILEPHDVRRVRVSIPMLPNGGLSAGIKTYGTCGFDAIFTIYASAFTDEHDKYYERVLSEAPDKNDFLKFVTDTLNNTKRKIPASVVKARNELLATIYGSGFAGVKSVTRMPKFIDIDCCTGIGGRGEATLQRPKNSSINAVLST